MKHALTILAWLILLALLVVGLRVARADAGPEDVVATKHDLFIVEHVMGHDGREQFVQVLFLLWNDELSPPDYECHAYRIIRSGDLWPKRDWEKGGYVMHWHDKDGLLRETRADVMEQRWSQSDLEVELRNSLPMEHRQQLPTPTKQPRR